MPDFAFELISKAVILFIFNGGTRFMVSIFLFMTFRFLTAGPSWSDDYTVRRGSCNL